jgi:hypothetical protein
METNPLLMDYMQVGLSLHGGWSGNFKLWDILPISPPVNEINPDTNLDKRYYRDFRKQLLWLNRLDLNPPGGRPRSLSTLGSVSAQTPILNGAKLTDVFTQVVNKLSSSAYDNHRKTIVYVAKNYHPSQTSSISTLLTRNNIQLIVVNVFQTEVGDRTIGDLRENLTSEFSSWASTTQTGQSIDLVMDPSIKQVPTTLTNLLNTRVSGVTGGVSTALYVMNSCVKV